MSCEIQVGFGRKDIMPIGSIELGGLGNGPHRKSENILDTLYATCIAITDSEGQALLLIPCRTSWPTSVKNHRCHRHPRRAHHDPRHPHPRRS